MKDTVFDGTTPCVTNLAEILKSPLGRDGTSIKVTLGLQKSMLRYSHVKLRNLEVGPDKPVISGHAPTSHSIKYLYTTVTI